MISNIRQASSLLDQGLSAFCQGVVMPTVRTTYHAAATLSISVTYVFSKSLSSSVQNAFYDPLSTSKIFFLSKCLEQMTGYFASRTLIDSPNALHYVDQSFSSMNQHLHSYTKRINDLLVVPENLRSFIRRFSFESLLNQVNNGTEGLVYVSQLAIQMKRIALSLVNLAIRVMDLMFRTVFLGVEFGLFSYLKEIIKDGQDRLHEKIGETAIESIERKESKLRKIVVAKAADFVVDSFVSISINTAVKSLIGAAIYFPTRELVANYLSVPSLAVDAVGLAVASHLLWKQLISPKLDAYYETYDPQFTADRLSFEAFCEKFNIQKFHRITSLAGNLFGKPISEN